MSTQCEILDAESLVQAEAPAMVAPAGEWRYALGGALVLAGALGLLGILADEALGGAVTEVLVTSLNTPGIFSR